MSDVSRLIAFSSIGVFNTLFDIFLWKLLLYFTQDVARIKSIKLLSFEISIEAVCHAVSYLLSIFVSYYLNTLFTFSDAKNSNSNSVIIYFLVSIFSLLCTTLLLNLMFRNKTISKIRQHLIYFENTKFKNSKMIKNYWPLFCKVVVTLVSLIINYVGYKYLVFNV
jgi:putative flippase GtrA